MFLPAPAVEAPPEDVKLFDARRLTLHQPASNDVSALVPPHTFNPNPRKTAHTQIRHLSVLSVSLWW